MQHSGIASVVESPEPFASGGGSFHPADSQRFMNGTCVAAVEAWSLFILGAAPLRRVIGTAAWVIV
eukprot:363759-Chlamydomonas_euryale.AAC.21